MPKAYVSESYRVPFSVLTVFLTLVGDLNEETRRLFADVYKCQRLNPGKFVPLSSVLIKKHWRQTNKGEYKANWGLLKDRGYLQVTEYDAKRGLSREFALTDEAFNLLNAAWPTSTTDYVGLETYSLFTGKRMKARGHVLTKENGHPLPALIKNSMLSITECYFNDAAILEDLETRFPGALANINVLTDPADRARFQNDKFAHDTLCLNNLEPTDQSGIFRYQPSYQVQSSGRVTENGRALQGCSRYMKHAAFKDIKNVHNYDMESAQIWVLAFFFEYAGLDANWLKDYLTAGKESYYTATGLDKSTWKACLISLILGSPCPKRLVIKLGHAHKSALVQYILDYHNQDTESAASSVEAFYNLTEPLAKTLEAWYEWLIKYHINAPGVASFNKGIHTVKNWAEMTFCVSDYIDEDKQYKDLPELKRKLGAFFLQGAEASFIHHLTTLQSRFGFKVISNQHDGLVTIGVIPPEAIELAKRGSGLRYANLIEKSFI